MHCTWEWLKKYLARKFCPKVVVEIFCKKKKKKIPWFLLPVIELDSDLRQYADSDEGSEISGFWKQLMRCFSEMILGIDSV